VGKYETDKMIASELIRDPIPSYMYFSWAGSVVSDAVLRVFDTTKSRRRGAHGYK
jgi:hypothetical protein